MGMMQSAQQGQADAQPDGGEQDQAQPQGAPADAAEGDQGQEAPGAADEDQGQEGAAQGESPDDGSADDSEAQDTGQAGSPADDTGGGPAAGEDMRSIPAKPEQQAEYNKANQMLYQTLYQNTGAGNAVVKGVVPTHKIDSAVKIAVLLVDQIDKKLNLDQAIILPFTKDVVAHVMDVAEQVKGIQYSDDEANAVLGSAVQAVLHIFGVTKAQAKAFTAHMTPEDHKQVSNDYNTALSKAKAATQSDPNAGGKPMAGGQPAGQAPAAQPAQPAAQGADEGADVDTPATDPSEQDGAAGGGMMQQAEQAQQGGGQQ